MRNITERNITDAVIAMSADCKDPRLKRILDSLVRHLHDFVRDVEPTEAEWLAAIAFLTRCGQMCDDKRQEFILLSDTLGVTMLVDAINHRPDGVTTESTVLGPFYVEGPPEAEIGAALHGGVEGERFYVEGVVSDRDGKPLHGVIVDVWQSDSEGRYDVQKEIDEASLRARLRTDANGRYAFWTVVPSPYPIPTDGPVGGMLAACGRHPYRPAHVHFMLQKPGFEKLVTQVFAEGDPYIDSDAVFGVKDSLIETYAPQPPGAAPDGTAMAEPWRRLRYDFHLRPAS